MAPVSSHSLAFSPLPQLLPPPLPSRSSSPGKELPIFPFLPFFSASILYSNVKYGLTSSVWLRGRLPVNYKFWPTLQFIWNGKSGKAIYWKWGGSLNFPPLKKFVFSHRMGSICWKNVIETSSLCLNEKNNSEKQGGLWFTSLFVWMRCQGMLWKSSGIEEIACCQWSSELYSCSLITSICQALLLTLKPRQIVLIDYTCTCTTTHFITLALNSLVICGVTL